MKIVLLPGLDGTGKLFAPLIKELSNTALIETINYNSKKELSYKELTEYVLKKLPSEDFILVAESFSGYIAYQIALKKPKNLKHIIAVASFLKNPNPIMLNMIFTKYIFLIPIPTLIIKKLLLGELAKKDIIKLFKKTIKSVSINVLYYRLQEIKNLKLETNTIKIPTTYIQAQNDKLVKSYSLKIWQKVCIELNIYKIKGEHFILQSNPKECGDIITRIVKRYKAIILKRN